HDTFAVVICSTCGKPNADHLTFCEDCGARLRARIVPPTPPVGLGIAPVPTPGGEMVAAPMPQPGLVSSPQLPAVAPSAPQIPAPGPSAPAIAGNTCPRCGAASAPNLRFCTSCG